MRSMADASRAGGPADPPDQDAGSQRAFVCALVLGVAVCLAYCLQARSIAAMASALAATLAVAAASLLVGALTGFLFGIPRSLQQGRSAAAGTTDRTERERDERAGEGDAPYQPNTNLEQISDWLAKILVGVGLTQLANIPGSLQEMGEYLAPGVGGFASSAVFAGALVVYFALAGFFAGYLWTRLNLERLFKEADLRARIRKAVAAAEKRTEADVLRTVANAPTPARTGRRVLWVDDNPRNNVSVQTLLTKLYGVDFDLSESTEDALAKTEANRNAYALVISDMNRRGDPLAGRTLLKELRDRQIDVPFIVFAGASGQERTEELRRLGAFGTAMGFQRLIEMVGKALGSSADPSV
ncbi:MAG TPA: response regulator [Kofleriaceae bacterium]|nr:response regulator [Kofleriaceae bacterium]